MKKRRCIIGQSGGPTVAINATLAGVIEKAYEMKYEKVYGMIHGIVGLLNNEIMDLSIFQQKDMLHKLIYTPAMYLGSCRHKLVDQDIETKQKIINILLSLEITDFFYIGGNDSMDTVRSLSAYAKANNISINFIG